VYIKIFSNYLIVLSQMETDSYDLNPLLTDT